MLSSEFEEQEQSFYVKTSTSLPRNAFVQPLSSDIVGQVEECVHEFIIDPNNNNNLIRNPHIIGRLSKVAHPNGAKADSIVLVVVEV